MDAEHLKASFLSRSHQVLAGTSAYVLDKKGHLYGTSSTGGIRERVCVTYGCGTAFELQRTSTGWTEVILHQFTGGSDGYDVWSGFTFSNNNLLGSALLGGSGGYGVLFSLYP